MARNFTLPSKEFSVANTDLEAELHFRSPDDPQAVVLDDMKFQLRAKFTDGARHGGTLAPVKVSDVLSGQALADFRAALVTLRDAAFDANGYTDV